jgi:hypothetical protein
MIQENELRIGNLLNHNNGSIVGSFIVGLIHLEDIIKDNSHAREYDPIPLTEEWLLKFGFKKTMSWTYTIDLVGNLKLVYYLGEKGFSIGFKNYSDFSNLKYVHQLQNLYFALTKQELEIKK